jgi:hypothetical protein
MDTRFWGPSGWKLLHLISFDYAYSAEHAITYAHFFETIPYILPCKFCRTSLTDYYREHPFQIEKMGMNPTLDVKQWMYTIHNCVNGKLRSQGIYPHNNPSFAYVTKLYEKMLQCSWEQQLLPLWDFLFAVGYHHPMETSRHSLPMPNCPKEVYQCKKHCERNKWNVLPMKWRMYWFKRFWIFLPAVLPYSLAIQWKKAEKQHPPTLTCRKSTMNWLWNMRCALDSAFRDPYTSVCKRIAGYSSDCGKKRNAITCRRLRSVRRIRSAKRKGHTMKK